MKKQAKYLIKLLVLCGGLIAMQSHCSEKESKNSVAFDRYLASNLNFEKDNFFFPNFTYQLTTGLGYDGNPKKDPMIQKKLAIYKKDPKGPYLVKLHGRNQELTAGYLLRHSIDGFQENTTFRDPSSPIKIGDTYHIWYSKSWGTPPVGQTHGSQEAYHDIKNKWQRIYSWDYVSIWHATSKDGYHWEEQGMALEPGKPGSYDDRNVFTPDILVANNKYYLYYQVARSPHTYRAGPHEIAMAWSDTPKGPWHKSDKPILMPSTDGGFDSKKVHDPSMIVKGGKYYLYYKGDGNYETPGEKGLPFRIGWGVAIADKPEGPFIKSELNPIVIGGHEVVIFPYKSGVCGMVRQGPELHTLQCAEDGLNFEIASHVGQVPIAGTFFRQGTFKDINKFPAKLPTWGLSHANRLGSKETSIVRYDIKFNRQVAH